MIVKYSSLSLPRRTKRLGRGPQHGARFPNLLPLRGAVASILLPEVVGDSHSVALVPSPGNVSGVDIDTARLATVRVFETDIEDLVPNLFGEAQGLTTLRNLVEIPVWHRCATSQDALDVSERRPAGVALPVPGPPFAVALPLSIAPARTQRVLASANSPADLAANRRVEGNLNALFGSGARGRSLGLDDIEAVVGENGERVVRVEPCELVRSELTPTPASAEIKSVAGSPGAHLPAQSTGHDVFAREALFARVPPNQGSKERRQFGNRRWRRLRMPFFDGFEEVVGRRARRTAHVAVARRIFPKRLGDDVGENAVGIRSAESIHHGHPGLLSSFSGPSECGKRADRGEQRTSVNLVHEIPPVVAVNDGT